MALTVINKLRTANKNCLVCDDKIEGFLPAVPIVCPKVHAYPCAPSCVHPRPELASVLRLLVGPSPVCGDGFAAKQIDLDPNP